MNKDQLAVDWIIEQIPNIPFHIKQKAREIEKSNIRTAYLEGSSDEMVGTFQSMETYFDTFFGKKKEFESVENLFNT